MTWNYAYTPQIWPPVLMAVLMTALAIYSGQRRSVPGATALMVASLFAATWAAGSFLEYAAMDLPTKIAWFKIQAAAQLPIAISITCFILEYAWPRRWLTRRNLALLALPGLLGVVMILTDDLNHLAWRSFSFANGLVKPQFGPGSWFFLAYSFGVLGLVNLLVFGWLFRRSPQHRWPVVLMLVGQLAGRMIFMMDRANLVPTLLPLDLLGMSLEFLMYAIVLFGFRILDPLTLARQTLVAQMRDGMLVLDPQGRVTSLNPAAESILGQPSRRLLGQSIQDLLSIYAGAINDLQASGTGQAEINLSEGHSRQNTPGRTPGRCGTVRDGAGTAPLERTPGTSRNGVKTGPESRTYQLELSSLNDFRGQVVGRMLLLRDVTDQKHAQVQLLEQQRALAILNERERLGRELHDSIGQVLGYVSLQAQAIRKRAQGGDLPAVELQLTRLAEVAQAAHADVRDSILSLRAAGTGQGWSFQSALGQYLKAYGDQYGIQTSLSLPEGFEERWFEPEAEVQLLRVIQEALTNARKHGRARCVQVAFEAEGGLVHLTIQDDGVGFDPSQAAGEGHYGLQFMRERVAALRGQIEVVSQPGQGTQIIVQVPRNLTQRRKDRKEKY